MKTRKRDPEGKTAPTGRGALRGDGGSFSSLDDDRVPPLQESWMGEAPILAAPVATAAPSLLVVIVLLDEVGDVEEPGLVSVPMSTKRLDCREHCVHAAQVDVPAQTGPDRPVEH